MRRYVPCPQYAEGSGCSDPDEWRAPGFKGVVVDADPAPDGLRPGAAVLCRNGDAPGMLDAVVLEVRF